jgi:lactate 2-monooxygenase
MSFAELERQAEGAMSAEMWSYVAGGAGDERTQRANVRAFAGWGLMPRMLAAAERDVSVELFGRRLATALALGARAVAIGRPYAYGLAVGGQPGSSTCCVACSPNSI